MKLETVILLAVIIAGLACAAILAGQASTCSDKHGTLVRSFGGGYACVKEVP